MGAFEESRAGLRKLLEPIFQEFEREYRDGQKEPILGAIAFSLFCGAEVPAWAKNAFINAYFHDRPRAWDESFGRPHPKGKKVASVRSRNETARRVFSRVRRVLAGGKVTGIEAALRQVGKDFGLSYPSARAIWYDQEARRGYAIYMEAFRVAQAMSDDLGPEPDPDSIALWFKQNDERIKEIWASVTESLFEIIALRQMSGAEYDVARAVIGNRKDAKPKWDQELCKLFTASGWATEALARKEGIRPRTMQQRLLFGRFLTFAEKRAATRARQCLNGLTEWRFRHLWRDTVKTGNEYQRFDAVLRALQGPPIAVRANDLVAVI
jgi:hypothetical protein